jgi:hypothetical protein
MHEALRAFGVGGVGEDLSTVVEGGELLWRGVVRMSDELLQPAVVPDQHTAAAESANRFVDIPHHVVGSELSIRGRAECHDESLVNNWSRGLRAGSSIPQPAFGRVRSMGAMGSAPNWAEEGGIMRRVAVAIAVVGASVVGVAAPAYADQPPGQLGYEGQPGNQGNGQNGYEGQPGNQGGGGANGLLGYEGQPGNQGG